MLLLTKLTGETVIMIIPAKSLFTNLALKLLPYVVMNPLVLRKAFSGLEFRFAKQALEQFHDCQGSLISCVGNGDQVFGLVLI